MQLSMARKHPGIWRRTIHSRRREHSRCCIALPAHHRSSRSNDASHTRVEQGGVKVVTAENNKLRVGVLGAGAWAHHAHIPGWKRDPRCEVVVLGDVKGDLARGMARDFAIPEASDDWREIVNRPDIDVIDIATPSHTHLELSEAAIAAGKHVLCEKPVAYDFRQTRTLAQEAQRKGVKTKLGFTF